MRPEYVMGASLWGVEYQGSLLGGGRSLSRLGEIQLLDKITFLRLGNK